MRYVSDCESISDLSGCRRPVGQRSMNKHHRSRHRAGCSSISRRCRMRRAILKKGDKTTAGGVVLEGIETCTHHGTPMTFIGAKIWCCACNSEGVIGWKGPHRTATMTGKQQALEGDICLCKCDPPPVLLASQKSAWHVFEAHELGEATGAGQLMAGGNPGRYDEQFTLRDAKGSPLADTYYTVRMSSRELRHGVTDSRGHTERYETDGVQSIKLYLGHRQEA